MRRDRRISTTRRRSGSSVTYEPGGSYDIYARLVTTHMGKHIPGNPAFNVQYMPGAGGLIGTLHLYEKAAQDGTEIGDPAARHRHQPDAAAGAGAL